MVRRFEKAFSAILLMAAQAATLPGPALAAPGDLDPAFGVNGLATFRLGSAVHAATGITVQADGKFIVSDQGGALLRFNPDHTPDMSWGHQGVLGTITITGLASGGGKLLAASAYEWAGQDDTIGNLYSWVFVTRYGDDGGIDPSFGQDGQTEIFFAGLPRSNGVQRFNAIATAQDGKIVAVGYTSGESKIGLVARYLPNGALDKSFGGTGWVRFSAGPGDNQIHAVAVRPDGKIMLAGEAGGVGFTARLDGGGALDPSFNGGSRLLAAERTTDCRGLLLDGSRTVLGCSQRVAGQGGMLLFGLGPDGLPDANFQRQSVSFAGPQGALSGLAQGPDGRLFAVGRGGPDGGRLAVLGFDANGGVDGSFADRGIYLAPETERSEAGAIAIGGAGLLVAGQRATAAPETLVLAALTPSGTRSSASYWNPSSSLSYFRVKHLPNGQILVGGSVSVKGQGRQVVSRLNPDGGLDLSFGALGHATVDPGDRFGVNLHGLELQADGKVLLTGAGDFGPRAAADGAQRVGVARLLADGAADLDFNPEGQPGQAFATVPNMVGGWYSGRSVRVQADGKILAVSGARATPSTFDRDRIAVARFLPDGTLDGGYGVNGVAQTADSAGLWRGVKMYDMALDAAGRVVVAGSHGSWQALLARFTPDGLPDATFGRDGVAFFSAPVGGFGARAAKVTVLADGKLLVTVNSTGGEVTLMRLNPDGSLDATFGAGGFGAVTRMGGFPFASDSVRLPDGRTVVAGYGASSGAGDGRVPFLARFLPDGGLDPKFGDGGVRTYPPDQTFFGIDAMPDGALLVATSYQLSGISFSGVLKTVAEPTVPACRLEASAVSVKAGAPVTLEARCNPAATRFAWGNTDFAADAAGGTVKPFFSATYSVQGGNADGIGDRASVDVAVTDTLALPGPRVDYTLSTVGTNLFLTGKDGVARSLAGIQRLRFADVSLALDTDGTAGQVYRLYQAAFNRAPDVDGLGFHMAAMEVQGYSLAQVAQTFLDSPEFSAKYGAATDRQFVQMLYANVLKRTPDAPGLRFYLAGLADGSFGRAKVLAGFSDSDECKALVAPDLRSGMLYRSGAGN